MTSKNREEITVRLDNGGNIVCPNSGFRMGNRVCVILDSLNLKVLDVMHEWVADMKWTMGQDEYMQTAMLPRPGDEELIDGEVDILPESDPKSYIEEEVDDGHTDDDIDFDIGQDAEVDLNPDVREYGIDDEEWHSEPTDKG
jgi:hypothetical protein